MPATRRRADGSYRYVKNTRKFAGMKSDAKLIVRGGLVVTMDRERRVFPRGAIAVSSNGRIAAVGPEEDITSTYRAEEEVDAAGRIVLPGLISSHTHLYGVLLRGAALAVEPPTDFSQILQRVWWPLDELLTLDDAYASALASSLELLKSGVTCFADTYSGPNSIHLSLDYIAKAVKEVGIRGILAFEATERHSKEEGMKGVEENIRFIRKVRERGEGLVRGMFSLHASFTVSDELMREVRNLATEYGVPITIHTSEGLGDVYHNLERYGKRTVERLRDVGLLGPDVVLAHCVHLTREEIDLLKETDAKVAHNPMSNMLNAVGVAPVVEMLKRGVVVGLGDDGYVFDMFENMRAALLLHRVHNRNPRAMDPQTVLEMATINGAKLYGLDRELGSLEAGKRADIVVIRPHVAPTPITPETAVGHIVNAFCGKDVETVIVDGKVVVREGRVHTVDEERVTEISQRAAERLWEELKEAKPQLDYLS